MISVPTVKESDLFVILPVKKHREAIGVVSGEDRSSIFTISAKSREKILFSMLNVPVVEEIHLVFAESVAGA